MMPSIAYALVVTFITLYAVLSSIEFGAALMLVFPKPLIERHVVERYMSPVWEATNVFLIFALVCTAMFFPRSIPLLAHLYAAVSIALLFFAVRIIGILGMFYHRSTSRIFEYLFALGSLGAPLMLSGLYLFALSGQTFSWPLSLLALALFATVLSALFFIATAFFLYFAPRNPHRAQLEHAHMLAAGAFLIAAAALFIELLPFITTPNAAAPWFVLVSFITSLAVLPHAKHSFRVFACSAVAVAALIGSIALLHAPYLIYPTLTIQAGFTAPETFRAMLISLPFGLLLAIPAVFLMWHLFARAEK